MNKISLVTRRKDKNFDTPTLALERAREREVRTSAPVELDKCGNPSLTVDLPKEDALSFSEFLGHVFKETNQATIATEITKEDQAQVHKLVFKFLAHEQDTTFLTAQQLSEMLRMNISTIYRMAKNKRIRAYKVGRLWRFNWLEIKKALGPDYS